MEVERRAAGDRRLILDQNVGAGPGGTGTEGGGRKEVKICELEDGG